MTGVVVLAVVVGVPGLAAAAHLGVLAAASLFYRERRATAATSRVFWS